MSKKLGSGSGIDILDHISQSLKTILWVKILKFFDADPESGKEENSDPGSGMEKIRIQDKHPGSATLLRGTELSLKAT
jgi:hypothetical protein